MVLLADWRSDDDYKFSMYILYSMYVPVQLVARTRNLPFVHDPVTMVSYTAVPTLLQKALPK